MSDPAVEAAQRVLADHPPSLYSEQYIAEAAAREALKPIRELYERFADYTDGPGDYRAGVSEVVRALAPLIFTAEELRK